MNIDKFSLKKLEELLLIHLNSLNFLRKSRHYVKKWIDEEEEICNSITLKIRVLKINKILCQNKVV